jgi:prepilin-type N-terminal cleavage/methylation domain-containing protein
MRPRSNTAKGFTLLELMVAIALGLIVLAATTQLFKSGMDATILVSQQSEMQQSVRSALNLIAKDVSMAGSGLPSGGVSLPNGTGSVPSFFAVDSNRAWLANNTYPAGTIGGAPVSNYMYGVIPGPNNGLEAGGPTTIQATGQGADAITVICVDYSFPLDQYTITFPAGNPNGDAIDLAPPATPPPGFPAILSPTGIQVGDLILLNNTKGPAIGEVTGISNAGGRITFADADPLQINQSGALKGNIKYIVTGSNTVARRVWAVTYFIEVPQNGQPPRLMRQVSGQNPAPVAHWMVIGSVRSKRLWVPPLLGLWLREYCEWNIRMPPGIGLESLTNGSALALAAASSPLLHLGVERAKTRYIPMQF